MVWYAFSYDCPFLLLDKLRVMISKGRKGSEVTQRGSLEP